MFTMLSGQRPFYDDVTRRETLMAGSLAVLGGLSLPSLRLRGLRACHTN